MDPSAPLPPVFTADQIRLISLVVGLAGIAAVALGVLVAQLEEKGREKARDGLADLAEGWEIRTQRAKTTIVRVFRELKTWI